MGAAGTAVECKRWHAAAGPPTRKATEDLRRFLRQKDLAFQPPRWGDRRHNQLAAFAAFIRKAHRVLTTDPDAFELLAFTPAPEED